MNKHMLQASFLMLTVATGQLLGASGSEDHTGKPTGVAFKEDATLAAIHEQMFEDASNSVLSCSTRRRIDSFSSEVDDLPASINRYSIITYLPNSKLDRLRVTLPTYGAPVVGTSSAPLLEKGSFKYVDQTAPLAASPLKIATLGQILNANPFKGSSIPTARKWLQLCVSGDGIDELVLDQTNESYDSSAPCSSTDPVLTRSQAAFKVSEEDAATLLRASLLNKRNLEQASAYLPAPKDYAQNLQLGILFGEVEPRRVDPHGCT